MIIKEFFSFFFIIRLPPKFLPVWGPLTRWCASMLGAALLCIALGQALDSGLVSRLVYTYSLFMVFSNIMLYLGMRKPNWQSSSNLSNVRPRSEPTLEPYSRAASSVGVMYCSSGPNTGSSSRGGWIIIFFIKTGQRFKN